MSNNKIVPVFFACDDNFVKFTMVTVRSLLENASKDYHYNIYVLNTNIMERMKQASFDIVNDYDNATLEFVDVTSYLDSISDRLPIRDYYSKTTYFRLFIAEMFPQYDKAIYLDSDMVVKGDISVLWNKEIGDNLVGAAHEQAMVQTDAYGDYVEHNIGISRHNFFNAGMLVINSKLWREEAVLDQFIDLLGIYTFRVTQDEDYLNAICQDRVAWVGDEWNVEIYENIKVSEEDACIFHYIMWSKPWHFTGVRYEDYFWKYARMNSLCDEIVNVLETYTDEQRAKDLKAGERLYALALEEIRRPDTFLMLKRNAKIQNDFKLLKRLKNMSEKGVSQRM
ncbi:MAG: glycosyltransferase family 8 protein [Acholeplasmatales bacterium]|nr:glycosyltransferase family 8 protein [Acholeplasmatales bacterium]